MIMATASEETASSV